MKVVITGGAGFIGANLARAVGRDPRFERTVVIDDLSTGSMANVEGLDDIEVRIGSVLDESALDEACKGADAIVHLAARPSVPRSIAEPLATHEANATGTLHVLEAARRAGGAHVIVASSSSVYGANPTLPKHEGLRCEPLSPYAVSKLVAESYGLAYQQCYGLPVLALRFFNVFGPFQPAGHAYAAVIPAFVSAAVTGQPLTVHGDGEQTRDFTYVGSVCGVLTDALARRVTSAQPVNLAFGSRRSLLEVIAELERLLGRGLAREHTSVRPGDVRDSQADRTRLGALFPTAEPVEFATGLAATVEWFRSLAPATS